MGRPVLFLAVLGKVIGTMFNHLNVVCGEKIIYDSKANFSLGFYVSVKCIRLVREFSRLMLCCCVK